MIRKTLSQKLKVGVGYIRESTEEQDKGFSPDNQRRSIEDYAVKHNIKVAEWYKDLVSGTKASKRDNFQRMITDAMQHKFEVILVYHTSRFARNVKEARQYKELLRKKLNIDVVSVTQNFGDDWTDPSSFLNEGINELFDEHTSRQISFWVRNSLMEKRRQGKQTGNPPLGYYKKKIGFDKEKNRPIYDKTWLVEPHDAKIVKKVFELYAAGKYSYTTLAAETNRSEHKTRFSHPFTYSSMKGILCNQAYLGLVYSPRRGYPTIKGLHPAIIGQKLFDKVQDMIQSRRNTIGRPVAQHRFYLLQGLIYCHRCMKHLKGKENDPHARLLPRMYCESHSWKNVGGAQHEMKFYGCKLRRENNSCTQPDVKAELIDKQVIQLMESFKLPSDVIELTLSKLALLFKQTKSSIRNHNLIDRLLAQKKRLNFQWSSTEELTESEYLGQLKEINDDLKKYEGIGLTKSDTRAREAEYIKKTQKFLNDFRAFWRADLGDSERRAWIQMTMKRIWVQGGKVVAIEPQEDFKPLFVSHKKVFGQAESDPR